MELEKMDFNFFANLAPQKYYDNKDMTESAIQHRADMLENKDNKYIATQKFDGEWCMLINIDGQILARSRSISVVTNKYGDFTAKIPHIVEYMKQWPNSVFIGELCFNDLAKTSKDVGSILRCLPAKAVERQKKTPLSFKIFDCLMLKGMSLLHNDYSFRTMKLLLIRDELKTDNAFFDIVPFAGDDIQEFLREIWEKGGEGIVIQDSNSLYTPGARPSWTSLKVKKHLGEIEVPVIGTIKPTKEYTGDCLSTWQYWCTSNEYNDDVLIRTSGGPSETYPDAIPVTKHYYYNYKSGIVVDYNGKTISISSGLHDDEREWLGTAEGQAEINNHTLFAVISAMSETEDKSLRHPVLVRLRNDVK